MNEIEEELREMCQRSNQLTIDEIERVLQEIKKILDQVELLEEGRTFRQLLHIYQSFLKTIHYFMLEYGIISSLDNKEDFQTITIRQIGELVWSHHYPSGALTIRMDPPFLTNLEFKLEEARIESKPSTNLPEYDTGILITSESMDKFREQILQELKQRKELFYSHEGLQNENPLEQHAILSIFSNLPKDMALARDSRGFRIIRKDKVKRKEQETTVYKISGKE